MSPPQLARAVLLLLTYLLRYFKYEVYFLLFISFSVFCTVVAHSTTAPSVFQYYLGLTTPGLQSQKYNISLFSRDCLAESSSCSSTPSANSNCENLLLKQRPFSFPRAQPLAERTLINERGVDDLIKKTLSYVTLESKMQDI
jgi:hypothetical protein